MSLSGYLVDPFGEIPEAGKPRSKKKMVTALCRGQDVITKARS
jgi:hypothetical protein